MKYLTRTLQTCIASAIMFAMPYVVSAGTVISTFTVTPTTGSAVAGTATTNTATVHAQASGTYTGGLITESSSVAYSGGASASPGITVSFSPNPFGISPGSLNHDSTFTVATAAGTTAGVYTVTIAGTNTVPSGKTVTYTLTVTSPGGGPIVWTPAGVNTNWSTAGNWTPSGPPVIASDVLFFDPGASGSAGTVDNVVNSTLTIGSLTYGQTNLFHTTLIPAGVKLTVGGDANGLVVGTGTDAGDNQLVTAIITGAGGALAVTNTAANVSVGQSHATAGNAVAQSQATLDLSGLDTLTTTVSRLLVGVDISIKGSSGVLNLAKTNSISVTIGSTAPQIDVGDNSQSQGSPTIQSVLRLGQTNGIYADSIVVGRGKTDNNGGLMIFNSAFTSPTAYFRGTNGVSSRVGTWFIGDGFGARTYYTYGTCDFSLGTVNARVDTMYVGRGAQIAFGAGANNPGTGTLTFGAGTVDINTLEVGFSTANASGTGTVNANGGALLVNTLLELGHASGSSGTLNISNGTVTANSGIAGGGGSATISMIGGTLNVTNTSATVGTAASALASFSVSGSTINLAVQNLAPSIATANLSAASGTTNQLNITAVPLLTGFPTQFPLIQYGLNGGSASGDLTTLTLGTLPAGSPAYGAYISNNVVNNSIDIVFTNGPSVPSLTWDGATNGNWDTTTSNWRPKTGPDTTFANGNFATFDESLTGTPNVNLTTALSPGSLTVSNVATSYVFSGAGSISGSTALVKNGSGTLTLSETGGDNFSGGVIVNNGTVILNNASGAISGGTTISGGTVQVGNSGVNGSLPAGNVVDSGALVFNRTSNLTVSNNISGAGTLTQNNTNVVTLSGNSTFTGTATVAAGTLQIGSTNGLGLATSITINSNATLDVGGVALYGGNANLAVTVAGAGVGGNGAIINSISDQSKVLHNVTLTGDTTFGGSANWDIRNSTGNSAGADATLNGAFNLTKVGTNSLSLRGVTIDSSLGNINVQAGSVTITATATAPQNSLGDPNAAVTVSSNATLTLDTIGNVPAKNFVLNNGGTLKSAGTNILGSPVTLTGAANNTITVNSTAQFTINNAIGGGGGFSKNGSGALFLSTNNSYSGNTVVSGGTLALYGGTDGSISSSVSININGGTTLDASGRSDGTFTLVSGQTLNGGVGTSGGINGILIASLGANVAPGTGTTNLGTLSVSSNATLHGTTSMKLNASIGANDRLTANAITYGGTLIVTNFAGTITNGQAFQLFAGTNGYSANFGSVTLPAANGLTWSNTLTSNGTITAAVVTVNTTSTNLATMVSGNQLIISWPADHTGWHLQAQTNTLANGLGTNWVTIPNTDLSNSYTNTINPAQGTVFYRMVYP